MDRRRADLPLRRALGFALGAVFGAALAAGWAWPREARAQESAEEEILIDEEGGDMAIEEVQPEEILLEETAPATTAPAPATPAEAESEEIDMDATAGPEAAAPEAAAPARATPAPAAPATPAPAAPATPAPAAVEPEPEIIVEPAPTPAPAAAPPRPEPVVKEEEELISIIEEALGKPAPAAKPVKPEAKAAADTELIEIETEAGGPPRPASRGEERPAPKKEVPPWSSREQARAFAAFLRAGLPLDTPGIEKYARVRGPSETESLIAYAGRDAVVEGLHEAGETLVAYRGGTGGCVARFIGVLVAQDAAGGNATRARITRSSDVITAGDLVFPLSRLRQEYERQVAEARQASSAGRAVMGEIACFREGRLTVSQPGDLFLFNRGQGHGVSVGWSFELEVPGHSGAVTYGRVVRVDRRVCTVKVLRVHQLPHRGDRGRLSGN